MKKTLIIIMLTCFIFSGCAAKTEKADQGRQIEDIRSGEISENYDQVVGQGKDIVDIFIDNTKEQLHKEKISEELKSLKKEFEDDVEAIYYASEDGNFIMDTEIELPEDYDPRTRPWYENALEKGTYISEVYDDYSSGNKLISIAKVIVENGETKGVIGVDMVLK